MYKILTIAGSDSCGGAGIQADLKTIAVHGMYGMSAITAITAQNTMKVENVEPVSTLMMKQQLDCVFQDIYPDGVKIGMLANLDNMKIVTEVLNQYPVEHVVLDPVMVSTSGRRLLDENGTKWLMEKLLPLLEIITPNIPEAEVMTNRKINTVEDMILAGKDILDQGAKCVLIKGGHLTKESTDILVYEKNVFEFIGEKIDNPNTHGTGCTLSAAIVCNLSKGFSKEESVERAKKYLEGAIKDQMDLGKGNGPLNHIYDMKMKDTY